MRGTEIFITDSLPRIRLQRHPGWQEVAACRKRSGLLRPGRVCARTPTCSLSANRLSAAGWVTLIKLSVKLGRRCLTLAATALFGRSIGRLVGSGEALARYEFRPHGFTTGERGKGRRMELPTIVFLEEQGVWDKSQPASLAKPVNQPRRLWQRRRRRRRRRQVRRNPIPGDLNDGSSIA
jgi:hypothetical protein